MIILPVIDSTGSALGGSLGKISDRIADELVRPDLRASHIPLAVNDAIKEAAKDRFWFNEVRGLTFTTLPNRDFYDAQDLADIAWLTKIDALWLTINGQRRNMEPVNALCINQWREGQTTLTGEPAYYARYGDGLLFWMSPSGAWTAQIDGVTAFAPLVQDSDESPWLLDGERYIRAIAKANLLENVLRDFAHADRQWQVAEREKRTLLSETSTRSATNRLVPSL